MVAGRASGREVSDPVAAYMTGREDVPPTRVYTLEGDELNEWVADADQDGHAFTKRSLSTGESKGTRIEIYGPAGRLLEAFTVS